MINIAFISLLVVMGNCLFSSGKQNIVDYDDIEIKTV